VEKNLLLTNISSIGSVIKNVQPVFNIKIEQDEVYYANGVLVSNCDSLAYQLQISEAPEAQNDEIRTEDNRREYQSRCQA